VGIDNLNKRFNAKTTHKHIIGHCMTFLASDCTVAASLKGWFWLLEWLRLSFSFSFPLYAIFFFVVLFMSTILKERFALSSINLNAQISSRASPALRFLQFCFHRHFFSCSFFCVLGEQMCVWKREIERERKKTSLNLGCRLELLGKISFKASSSSIYM